MDDLTVLVFPDRTSPVRRFKLARKTLWRAGFAILAFLVLVGVGTWDYLGARREASEVGPLRVETTAQRAQIAEFETRIRELDDQLGRVREFERKVRVIANLPTTGLGRTLPVVENGVGGADEGAEGDETGEVPGVAWTTPEVTPVASNADVSEAERAWHTRLGEAADRLLAQAALQESSLADLVDELRDKSHELASMPSILPAKGWLTSGFGRRISPFTGRPQLHRGIDIASEPGTEIVAPARGRVVFAGRKGPLGKAVVIDHGYGVETTYGHLLEILVEKGDEVERGQWIASLGNTGRSTGPHLHYAVSLHGEAVDPMRYILE